MSELGPVLKWAGGKRQLVATISPLVPPHFTTYYEPFLGGGAVLFALRPVKAVVNDLNSELINVYCVIRDQVEALIEDLETHQNLPEYYYQIRRLDRNPNQYGALSPVQRASRLLYLNKTCYNGLYRVNSKGEFNTPFGRYKNPNIVNETKLRRVSEYFNSANIQFCVSDFGQVLQRVEPGSFVYLDPPYDPLSASANFTSYHARGFGRHEQIRLKHVCDSLDRRQVHFLLSNAKTPFIESLYEGYPMQIVQAKRVVNSRPDLRGEVEELLIMNYKPGK